ncbi:MAG: hypothetical protein H6Q67_22 [Firmicutes bacterium]|nr:hypothetical protein [Bacillota bacterium]
MSPRRSASYAKRHQNENYGELPETWQNPYQNNWQMREVSRQQPQNADTSAMDKEVLQLLQNMSQQLQSLSRQNQSQEGEGGAGDVEASGKQQPAKPNRNPSANASSQDEADDKLRVLLSKLLAENKNPGVSNNTILEAADNAPKTTAKTDTASALNSQTAAQALSQAQFELSEELRASLTKLKQVIDESEKIANKISSLLETENNNEQS